MFKNMIHTLQQFFNFYTTAGSNEEKLRLAEEFVPTELPAIIDELKNIELKEE